MFKVGQVWERTGYGVREIVKLDVGRSVQWRKVDSRPGCEDRVYDHPWKTWTDWADKARRVEAAR